MFPHEISFLYSFYIQISLIIVTLILTYSAYFRDIDDFKSNELSIGIFFGTLFYYVIIFLLFWLISFFWDNQVIVIIRFYVIYAPVILSMTYALFLCLVPKWKHPNIEIRKKVIAGTKNTKILGKIAESDSDFHLQRMAKWKLTELKVTEVSNLSDQRIIEHFAKSHSETLVRKAALLKLTDQKKIEWIAKNDKAMEVRVAAWKRLGYDSAYQIESAVSKLNSVKKDERLHAAEVLIDFASTHPELLLHRWDIIRRKVQERHQDNHEDRNHSDGYGESWNNRDCGPHYDYAGKNSGKSSGIGLEFPPPPVNR